MFASRTVHGRRAPGLLPFLAVPAFLLAPAFLRADDPSAHPRVADDARIRTSLRGVARQRPGHAPWHAGSWSLEYVSGLSFGGPTSDLAAAMRSAGFADSARSWLGGGTISYPQVSDGIGDRTSSWGAARRRLGRGAWHVGIGAGTTKFGTVTGYREGVAGAWAPTWVETESRAVTLAAMAWFEPVRALRLGAGPAVHRVDLDVGSLGLGTGRVRTRSWKPGFVVEAALTVPVDTPVFFAALVQCRFAGRATTGPWEATATSGARAVFPEASVSVSHGFVALGIGGRF